MGPQTLELKEESEAPGSSASTRVEGPSLLILSSLVIMKLFKANIYLKELQSVKERQNDLKCADSFPEIEQ